MNIINVGNLYKKAATPLFIFLRHFSLSFVCGRNSWEFGRELSVLLQRMAGVPFKLYLPSRQVKLGVVAQSLKHLHSIIKDKLDFAEQATLSLEDGTLICSEDYFELLEPQTTLVVQSSKSVA